MVRSGIATCALNLLKSPDHRLPRFGVWLMPRGQGSSACGPPSHVEVLRMRPRPALPATQGSQLLETWVARDSAVWATLCSFPWRNFEGALCALSSVLAGGCPLLPRVHHEKCAPRKSTCACLGPLAPRRGGDDNERARVRSAQHRSCSRSLRSLAQWRGSSDGYDFC